MWFDDMEYLLDIYWLGHCWTDLRIAPSERMVLIMSREEVSAMVRCSQLGISDSSATRGLGPQPW